MADRNPDVVKKRYGILKGKIQGPGKEYLDSDIDSDAHLRKIANLMDKWTVRPDLLGLKINPDVQGILQNKHLYPTNEDQRKRAVLLWKERTGTPTYNALLLICVKGEMDDAAKEIVRILNEEPPMPAPCLVKDGDSEDEQSGSTDVKGGKKLSTPPPRMGHDGNSEDVSTPPPPRMGHDGNSEDEPSRNPTLVEGEHLNDGGDHAEFDVPTDDDVFFSDYTVGNTPSITKANYRQRFTRTLLDPNSLLDKNLNGNGTKIAIIDATQGFHAEHLAFLRRKVKMQDFLKKKSGYGSHDNHATACAGIAIGDPFKNKKNELLDFPGGVAPGAKAKVFLIDLKDKTTYYNALDAIIKEGDYDVVSISLGCNIVGDPEMSKRFALLKGKTIVVAAAGNAGDAVKISYPAIHSDVISVGSLNYHCRLADSTATRKVDIFCYGEVMAPTYKDPSCPEQLKWSKGTSMATPAIAGLVCLIVQCANKYKYPNIKDKEKIMVLLGMMIIKSDESFDTSGVANTLNNAFGRPDFLKKILPLRQ